MKVILCDEIQVTLLKAPTQPHGKCLKVLRSSSGVDAIMEDSVVDFSSSPRRFGWVDYVLFAITLAISSIVGIYHAWKGAGNSTSDYLMGGKTMGIFPIAMSFAAR